MEQKIENSTKGEARGGDDQTKWVYDSSIDHKGRVPLRASTGVWKAALFIIAIEFSERLSYFGMASNLIIYLTKVIHQDLKTAAKSVNYWSGFTTMMPLVGGFLADAYTGRFFMVLLSSTIYLMGLLLLSMTQYFPSLKACNLATCTKARKVHEVVFFAALYFISLGTGGHKPCLESFGADQFDDDHLEERKKKMSYFNWWNFALCSGLVFSVTVIVYVEDYVSWGAAFLVLTITMAVSLVIFYYGKRFYRYRLPEGSPLTPMLQVLVAAFVKRNLPHPSSPALLYEVPKSQKSQGRLLCHTNNLRFLDKAAIIEDSEDLSMGKKQSPWRLATVTKVEELKLLLNVIPIWLSSLPFGICVAQSSTFFIKQASAMNRKIFNDFEIPPASIYFFGALGMIVSVTLYDKVLVPILRKATGNERGINILPRIAIGMIILVLGMAVSALVEQKRLATKASMSVFWLAPQFIILGFGDGFTLVGLQEYFYDQVPDSMRSLGIAFYLSVIGAGSFLSSLLIIVLDYVTDKRGTSWFGKDLKSSRLDYFFWFLAVMCFLNLSIFLLLARRYSYKNVQRRAVADCHEGSEEEQMA
ncbi:Proton-dependent oligopeptide transporter family [Dillenia turbinata]|uniref:Proton-dependent oligopeptide transporter family n=1 Tax=Dillenia turbinata TaxID=194707 RepID=A0AAN8VFF6_9MAGN